MSGPDTGDTGHTGPSVHGRRKVSGLTGLVRYHCETVMSSMVATSLDMVDTKLRSDMVSVSVYVRYHATLAEMLAQFTSTLATMLSGKHVQSR